MPRQVYDPVTLNPIQGSASCEISTPETIAITITMNRSELSTELIRVSSGRRWTSFRVTCTIHGQFSVTWNTRTGAITMPTHSWTAMPEARGSISRIIATSMPKSRTSRLARGIRAQNDCM